MTPYAAASPYYSDDYVTLIVARLDKPVQLGLNFEEPAS